MARGAATRKRVVVCHSAPLTPAAVNITARLSSAFKGRRNEQTLSSTVTNTPCQVCATDVADAFLFPFAAAGR